MMCDDLHQQHGESVDAAVVEVLEGDDAGTAQFEKTLDLYHHGFSQELAPSSGSVRIQYQPTLSLFEFLLTEREDASAAAEDKSPLDAQVANKVAELRALQAELERVVSDGLMSEARQRWLVDKAALEEKKSSCARRWADLQARQSQSTDAWRQLADKADGRADERPSAERTSALVASAARDMGVPEIFSKTSPKATLRLIREQVALSEEQIALDEVDEALMADALHLYQEERPARERREQIIGQQQVLLTQLQALVEDKSAFGGHATFLDGGFAEGQTY